VTGIGHEVDFTIADFVADVRAPTPSGAAELVVPDAREWVMRLETTLRRIVSYTKRHLQERGVRHGWLERRLAQCHPGIRLAQQAQRLDELEQRLGRALSRKMETSAGRLRSLEYLLARVSPIARLRDFQSRRQQAELRMRNAMRHVFAASQTRIEVAARGLNAVSPLATLDRGYAIVTKHPEGELVRSSEQLKPGDRIEARLNKGRVRARVEDKDQ
jgi:exodeoxyribonuclease VII large subunit